MSAVDEESLDPFITDMHSTSGLIKAARAKHHELGISDNPEEVRYVNRDGRLFAEGYATTLEALEDALLMLIPLKKNVERDDITALAGSSVHFDLSFLRIHMPRLAANVSHRCYDVSAVKLFCRSLGVAKFPREEAHRALPDVKESMKHARWCASWLNGAERPRFPDFASM